ncbi:GGDEF domain-containing protein [Eubacteriales bacterium OttesenSCG-928-A19]|nr:GGDEF domain-containing protein [Eubacteriales bacterium OttesenSCG-928-A19]
MNKLKNRAEKRQVWIVLLFIVMFGAVSVLSFTSIRQMQGNARVVNYVGIVRGATQKLVKRELMGYPDDALIERLDSIIHELITGEGPNDLVVLHDEPYLANMRDVRDHWQDIKRNIYLERAGEANDLFESSEEYFNLVDRTVSSAEAFSEAQVNRSITMLVAANAAVVVLMIVFLVFYLRTIALRKRADALGKIAYIDPLTQMDNRASCERKVDSLQRQPPEGEIAVFMFDMNNLKRVNDLKGHQGGDRIIADFARILKAESAAYGFIGRYGGDEFLAVFEDADDSVAQKYIASINEKVLAYNLLHIDPIERISFAVGYYIGSVGDMAAEEMIALADARMYDRKREMKENQE